jgi:5-methylcytosine-specific restriction endonuclease McrA
MKHAKIWHRKQRWLNVTRLMARDGQNCSICNKPLIRAVQDPNSPDYITFDHIVPRAHGGVTSPMNLRLAHRYCNEMRGSDPLVEETSAT